MSVAASFDCAKAKSKVEKLVCADANLSQLDERLSDAYKDALVRTSDKRAVTQWQRDWLGSDAVDGCKTAACLSKEYSARIQTLEQVAAEVGGVRWTGNYIRLLGAKDDESSQIRLITLAGNRIFVSGLAYWEGAGPGQVNTGEMQGVATITNAQARFSKDGCKAQLSLRGERLVVDSESGCGGMNVSFDGEYRRR